MANIQSQFGEFHEKIKLSEENEDLREKRDVIIDLLRTKFNEKFTESGEVPPVFEEFNQGSYAMHTGTVPLEGDYDIDVGLRFMLPITENPNPVQLKEWIRDALQGHTQEDVDIKEPCVRVVYSLEGEPSFHVDLAIYSSGDVNPGGKMYLARGKPDSDPDKKVWEEADPQNLLDTVNNHYPGEDQELERKQFRRVIRYLKRWKDLNFVQTGHSSPVGIGLTVAALQYFTPFVKDLFTNTSKIDDLSALINMITSMINSFQSQGIDGAGKTQMRLFMNLPTAPFTDVFSKMTNAQMTEFMEKLKLLKEELESAKSEIDPHAACKRLSEDDVFGEDFPVPPKEETGEPRGRAYTSSGQSG